MCCSGLRPGRSTLDLGRLKKICGAVGMLDVPLFKGRCAMHSASCVSPCMSLHVSVHLQGTLHVSRPPVRCPAQHPPGRSYAFKYSRQTKPADSQQILCNRVSYYTCEPTQSYGKTLSDPVSRLWECLPDQAHSQGYGKLLPLVAQIPGWGSQTASVYLTEF